MALIWVTILLLSLSWYSLTGIYEPTNIHYVPPLWFSFTALAGAILCGVFSGKIVHAGPTRKDAILLFFPAVFFSLAIPFPYNLCSIFLATGVLLLVLHSSFVRGGPSGLLQRLWTSVFLCALVLALHTLLLPFFFLFASRYHRVDIASPVMAFLLNVLGSSSSSSEGNLFVQSADRVYSFIPSWDGLGLYWMLNLLLGGYCLFYMFSAPKRYYVMLPVTLLLYMLIRYLGIIFTFLEGGRSDVFWRLDVLTLSLLPLPWLLAKALPSAFDGAKVDLRYELHSRDKSIRWFALSVAVLAMSCVSFFGFVDPGETKQGRILIDEKHSNWEWTTEEFNTTWYGEKSTYNYYSLAEYLKYFYKVDQKSEQLTEDLLRNYDILFIKTPTEPFSESEVSAVKSFVESGGGLLLVGDHTNVFGITTNLNPLASQFGVKFRYDGQYDLSGELSIYRKPKVLPHPVVQAMPPFMFATGCMLDVPLMAENPIIGYGIKSIYLDYARKNFFPKDARNAENIEFGLFVQAAGVPFGKGRVFFFTDSTVWSNFYMFIPGKPELLLGIMEWLNRRNSLLVKLRPVLLAVGFLALIAAIIASRRLAKGRVLLTLFSVGFLVTPIALLALEYMNRNLYPLPQPHTPYVKVNFESEHSQFELPVLHTTQHPEKSYHTFYVWLQRLGYVPSLKPSVEEALSDGDAVVIINPHIRFDKTELQGIKDFLHRGGKLFVMDDPHYTRHRTVNQLLSIFGGYLTATDTIWTPVILEKSTGDTARIASFSAGEVRWGTALVLAQNRISLPGGTGAQPGLVGEYYPIAEMGAPPMQSLPPAPNARRKLEGKIQQNLVPSPIEMTPRSDRSDFKRTPFQVKLDTTSARPVLSVGDLGRGKLAVMASSYLFTDREMGSTSTMPTTNMRRIYELEYWIFQEVLKLGNERGGSR